MWKLFYKIKQLYKCSFINLHRRMLFVKNNAMLIIINIRRILKIIVSISQFYRNYSVVLSRRMRNMSCISLIFFTKKALRILILFRCCRFCYVSEVLFRLRQIYRNINLSILGICGPFFILFDSVPSDVISIL